VVDRALAQLQVQPPVVQWLVQWLVQRLAQWGAGAAVPLQR
jgi:hypothetical protein